MILKKVWRYQRGNHEDFKTRFLKLLFKNNIYILHTFLLLLIKKTLLKLDMNWLQDIFWETNLILWKVWGYQRVNQNSWIEKGHTMQWPKEKEQKDIQNTKEQHEPHWKTGGELRYFRRVNSSCSTSGTSFVSVKLLSSSYVNRVEHNYSK